MAQQQKAAGREKVSLSDNLPKQPAEDQVQQLKKIYYANETTKQKYFPLQKQVKYQSNFGLFDRNDDKLLDYEQLKQFLISIGQMINEDDLKQFYRVLCQSEQKQDGHIEQGISLDKDIEEQLTEAFKIIDSKNQGFLESQQLKQMLMAMGYKWSEDQADQFIKQFEPKSQKKVYSAQVVKKLIKR